MAAYNFVDLTGQTFNNLTVIKRAKNNKYNGAMWICQCHCGNITKPIRTYDLKNNKVQSCGCLRNKKVRETLFKDLSGKKYGKLTVIKLDHFNKNKKAVFQCICDCGNKILVVGNNLQNGDTKSCGCIQKEKLYFADNFIKEILEKNNIKYKTEYSFSELKSFRGAPLRFDYVIISGQQIQYIIEFMGEQHDYFVPFFHGTEKNFIEAKKRDAQKKEYCKQKGIPLYIIPYKDRKKIKNLESLLESKYLER